MSEISFSFIESSSTDSTFQIGKTESPRARKPATVPKAVVSAVYSHIRAMRTLGHGTINTSDIAKALSLPMSQVSLAVDMLEGRGVKRK